MPARILMIQGTTSDAGKSTPVTGLCRWLRRRGVRVAPFKPQNMALNSAVTADGGEIGRAQAVQAQGCGLAPHGDMNPVLLKPDSDTGAQVIVQGKVASNFDARGCHGYKALARRAVFESCDRLSEGDDVLIVEGARSPAEINLRDNDIADMGFADGIETRAARRGRCGSGFAEAVDCPVLLVADIDRGDVFAHLIGTLALLSEAERARACGFVISRLRGDRSLLQPGIEGLERETGSGRAALPAWAAPRSRRRPARRHARRICRPVPACQSLPTSCARCLPHRRRLARDACTILHIVVPVLPHISNHTDFDPLRLHPQVALRFAGSGEPRPATDLVVLPGSKSVRADIEWLRAQGWDDALRRHLRYGGKLIGICGYEIHHGINRGMALTRPAVRLGESADGVVSDDNRILGTYVHGLFESGSARDALLRWAGLTPASTPDYAALREAGIERIADAVEQHLDPGALSKLLKLPAYPASTPTSRAQRPR